MAARFPRFHVGVTPFKGRKCAEKVFQSTHPRGVRRHHSRAGRQVDRVSIHAPAWGATTSPVPMPRLRQVSIHAPAWGATFCCPDLPALSCVSIHAPAWGATTGARELLVGTEVSIHAPAWGATRKSARSTRSWTSFNPRTRVGCDATISNERVPVLRFNPRTRVGCDISALQDAVESLQFQSTHPRGVRPPHVAGILVYHVVSIHAPAWGATPPAAGTTAAAPRFNPRTRVGCDEREGHAVNEASGVSIHAPAWGATR